MRSYDNNSWVCGILWAHLEYTSYCIHQDPCEPTSPKSSQLGKMDQQTWFALITL